jgi:hypothetical protein
MQLKNSTLIVLIACIAGVALLFGYFSYHNKNAPPLAEPETAASEPPSGTPSVHDEPSPAEENSTQSAFVDNMEGNKTAWQTYKPAEPDSNTSPETETPEQPALAECTGADCGERVLAFLADPNNDEAAKVAMAKTWLKPESKDETLSLLRLLREAYDAKQYDLKDRLLQMLAGADSGESAEQLIAVLNGELTEFSLQELPEDLRYEIKKAIRLNPDERIGKLLAEEFSYQRPDETVLEAIQDVKRPDMVYELMIEADQRGETEKVGELMQSLQSYSDPRTLEVLMRLGDEKILTEEDAAKAAYDWADAHGESFNQEQCEAYLSEPEASSTQRTIAAMALAASSDPARALAALQKAYDNESDQNLRLAYEEAITRARRRSSGQALDSDQLTD